MQAAVAKAKGEIGTEYDNVAIENICAGYVGGVITDHQTDLKGVMKGAGWEAVLTAFDELFPDVGLVVTPP